MDVRRADERGSWASRRHQLFIGYVILMLLAFLLPVPTSRVAETTNVDKLVHFGIFLGFTLLFYADKHSKAWWTFLLSAAFAGAIELAQSALPYRNGDWVDFIAGAAGAALGTVLVLWRERRRANQGL
jgi:VanZ family protein